ncbi:MAG TPA: LPS export ABC transporter permease LptG [Deltaproteobacteria bacterium]|nr:MAG: LPS export ABC transporter permease LptG [Deltaproteobacteria bacterium GWA2_55_82]OGQ62324.1 MAG: LPS export ABC transporter permease LptG [Deltaproteobacteria bacterium RIFCSPLOWO2_02_FULL_55_12]OIJ74437.1 MAG: LPS export ABC transporter permease LptG [Deltaproteobacteria bacterium GWC2_55_46]HBG47090.1 LPS export ABC transporter permease LptG [Deltaproteobacteria bacterium]HCY10850.1 LPS export ABC transporter permease LptG [Deltaproteobacteria bacterium]
MKILQRYMLSEFLKLLAIAGAGFLVLFITVDLFENMDNLIKHDVPFFAAFSFFLYKVPFIIGQVSPIAALVASLLSLGLLSKHGEITAMKAGGVKLLKAVYPLLAAGLAISLAVILMNEYVAPAALKKADSFRNKWFGEHGGTFGREGLWVKTNEGILNVKHVDFANDRLYGITYFIIGKPFSLSGRVQAKSAAWTGEQWVAEGATAWAFTEGAEAAREERAEYVLSGVVEPEELVNMENFQQNLSFADLRAYVKELEKEGYEATKYKIDLWDKLTFPLVNFIMVLVGIPFALKTGRHSGIAAGVGLSIVIAFSYWGVFALTRSLGQAQMVPPVVAAVFPDLLFLAIGALMIGYVKE